MREQGQPALQSLECASGSWDIVSIGDSYQITEFGAMGATAIYGYKHLFTFLRRRRGVGACGAPCHSAPTMALGSPALGGTAQSGGPSLGDDRRSRRRHAAVTPDARSVDEVGLDTLVDHLAQRLGVPVDERTGG